MPVPAQPVWRRRRHAPWQPELDAEPLAPWDAAEHPQAARLLESSIVIGTAEHPLWVQPAELVQSYLGAFAKVAADIERVLTAPYVPVQPWPPWEPTP